MPALSQALLEEQISLQYVTFWLLTKTGQMKNLLWCEAAYGKWCQGQYNSN